jgi:outer membrane receptor protein involved in Fe transport
MPLDDAPADNITPVKVLAAARFTEPQGRWWAEYGIRTQTDVTRVTPTLLSTPFRIGQDFLSLDGFVVQRLGWGVDVSRGRNRLALVFAVENLANRYYREHFQFAPAARTFVHDRPRRRRNGKPIAAVAFGILPIRLRTKDFLSLYADACGRIASSSAP